MSPFARQTFTDNAAAAGVSPPPPGALAGYARRLLDTELPAARSEAENAGSPARLAAISAMTQAAEALLEHARRESERRGGRGDQEPAPPTDLRGTIALGIDPGAAHTGVVLARVRWGSAGPVIVPLDGLTIDRHSGSERVGHHAGAPRFGLRCVAEIGDLLTRHDVREPWLVAVESVLAPTPIRSPRRPPRGAISARVAGHVTDLAVVVGVVAGTWPSAQLVAPADADHAGDWPAELRGRRPAGWTPTGSARQHQRAAWSVLRSGLEAWLDERARRVAVVLESAGTGRSISALLDAARDHAGAGAPTGSVIEIGARSAVLMEPATELAAMRRRLHERIAQAPAV